MEGGTLRQTHCGSSSERRKLNADYSQTLVTRVEVIFTYAGVAMALGAVTLLATYLPARRASLVQPIIALRSGM